MMGHELGVRCLVDYKEMANYLYNTGRTIEHLLIAACVLCMW